jgi:methylmalonyl-CoA mutase
MKSLFSSFNEVSLAEWKAKLAGDLKGRTFEELCSPDESGVERFPFYNIENQKQNTGPLFQNPDWEICTKILVEDAQEANSTALEALNGGASGLAFHLERAGGQLNLEILLKDISISNIFTRFIIQKEAEKFARSLNNYLIGRGLDINRINCCIDYDPLAACQQPGNELQPSSADYLSFMESTTDNVSVDTAIYQNAGANAVAQLAFGLGHLNEYLGWMEESKILDSVKRINFKVATGTSFFDEIAKLRALRLLLPPLLEAYGIQPEIMISAETSDMYRTPVDTYNNILRDSIAGMAAVLGGCDSLVIHDFNQKGKKENAAFGPRMARNQQLIFKEESYFNKVADVAAGSFYIETLSIELAEKAWQLFREMNREGDFITFIKTGVLQQEISIQANRLIEEYKTGKRTLVGINKFQNPKETPDIEWGNFPQASLQPGNLSPVNLALAIMQQ